MNEYLLSVLGTVLLCSLLTAICPEGKTSTVIKGVARLACVLTIVSPMLYFFRTGSFGKNQEDFLQGSVIQTDEAFIQYYSEARIVETERALLRELQEFYPSVAAVKLDWTMTEEAFGKGYSAEYIRIDRINVEVLGEVSEEVRTEMSAYLTKNYCSEVLIE